MIPRQFSSRLKRRKTFNPGDFVRSRTASEDDEPEIGPVAAIQDRTNRRMGKLSDAGQERIKKLIERLARAPSSPATEPGESIDAKFSRSSLSPVPSQVPRYERMTRGDWGYPDIGRPGRAY
jgi:hypothetical protein